MKTNYPCVFLVSGYLLLVFFFFLALCSFNECSFIGLMIPGSTADANTSWCCKLDVLKADKTIYWWVGYGDMREKSQRWLQGLWPEQLRRMEFPFIEMRKAVENSKLQDWKVVIQLWTCYELDVSYISKWICWVNSCLYEPGVKGESSDWRL